MSLQQQQLNQRTPGQQQNSQPMRKTATSMMQPSITRPQDFHFDSFTTSTAATPIQPSGGDTELSDIVNSVIDLLPEYQGTNLLSGILPETSSSQPSQQPQNQEEMAINAITKSLMQIESTGAFNSSPPAYSMHNVNTSSQVSVFRKFEFFVPVLTIFFFFWHPPGFSTTTGVHTTKNRCRKYHQQYNQLTATDSSHAASVPTANATWSDTSATAKGTFVATTTETIARCASQCYRQCRTIM